MLILVNLSFSLELETIVSTVLFIDVADFDVEVYVVTVLNQLCNSLM